LSVATSLFPLYRKRYFAINVTGADTFASIDTSEPKSSTMSGILYPEYCETKELTGSAFFGGGKIKARWDALKISPNFQAGSRNLFLPCHIRNATLFNIYIGHVLGIFRLDLSVETFGCETFFEPDGNRDGRREEGDSVLSLTHKVIFGVIEFRARKNIHNGVKAGPLKINIFLRENLKCLGFINLSHLPTG